MKLTPALCGLFVLAGCQAPGPTAREEADKHWRVARAQVKFRLAADQLAVGNVSAAAAELEEAAQLDPENAVGVGLRARVLLAEGQPAATADLLSANQTDGPGQADRAYLLGVARQQQQRWEEALTAFQAAHAADSQQVAYLIALVQTQLQLERTADALATLAAVRERFGWTSAYHAALAECYEQLGDWNAAAGAWQAVGGGQTADAGLRERLARALCRAQRYPEARAVLAEIREDGASEQAGSVRLLLAECALWDQDLGAAQAELRPLLQANPDDAGALRLMARCRAIAGDYDGAWEAAERVRRQKPRDIPTLELCAALAWRAGRLSAAAETIATLHEVMPGNALAAHLAEALRSAREP